MPATMGLLPSWAKNYGFCLVFVKRTPIYTIVERETFTDAYDRMDP